MQGLWFKRTKCYIQHNGGAVNGGENAKNEHDIDASAVVSDISVPSLLEEYPPDEVRKWNGSLCS